MLVARKRAAVMVAEREAPDQVPEPELAGSTV